MLISGTFFARNRSIASDSDKNLTNRNNRREFR